MRILFSGVGEARDIYMVVEHPTCPQVGESVQFGPEDDPRHSFWTVRAVDHMINARTGYDVYCVVGAPHA